MQNRGKMNKWDEDEPAPESGDSDGDGPIILDGDDEGEDIDDNR